ncbi:PREDICTED: AP-5 complex subunit sigma-1 isoform X1 [Capra hircus]|nr:PREDICTED: AP-5 complex subunit sigma-1 isoform X1 [Capra hircus]
MSRSDARPLLACAGAQVQPPFCPFTRGTWPVIRSLQARKERAMVHAFLIHTLRAAKAEEGLCRVLYSCFFGAENSPNDPQPHGAERDRLLRKEQILAVARQVESMFQLQQQACGRHAVDLQPQSSDDPVALHEAPCGVFRLAPGDPFQEPRIVVWLGVLSIGFALVLDTHENLLLVESTLRLLARLLLDHLRLLVPGGANLLLRADLVEGILTRFLPHGQLLFLNDQFVQGLEKEFSAAWSH